MIPLHYLHTGPPSCACLPHCPLHCFSMEVVITKANISCSLCLQLPLHFPVISFSFCSAFMWLASLHADCCNSWRYASVDGSTSETHCVCVSAVLWDYLVPSWCVIKAQCGTPDLDQSSGSLIVVQQQRNAWCTTALSVVLYIVGLTGWDQRDAPSCMAFFIINNALTLLAFFFLSHWNYGFIKGDSLLRRIFSNVFFSQPFP